MLLHDPSTKIYHQALLRTQVFRNLLPPTYYSTGRPGYESSFSYTTFRRAIRTHMAIRNGDLNPAPKQYKLERYGTKVEAGPILADGFLVWLVIARQPFGYATLKIVDLTRPATDRNLDLEWGDEINVAEFTYGSDHKIHRNGYDPEWINLHTLDNMTWRALGCGGGLAAYWIAGEYVIPTCPPPPPVAVLGTNMPQSLHHRQRSHQVCIHLHTSYFGLEPSNQQDPAPICQSLTVQQRLRGRQPIQVFDIWSLFCGNQDTVACARCLT